MLRTMAKAETNKSSLETVETVNKLLALAQDENGESEEARTSAVKAAQMIKSADLVVVPRAELEAAAKVVEGAEAIKLEAKKERQKGMMLGGILGIMLGKKGVI